MLNKKELLSFLVAAEERKVQWERLNMTLRL